MSGPACLDPCVLDRNYVKYCVFCSTSNDVCRISAQRPTLWCRGGTRVFDMHFWPTSHALRRFSVGLATICVRELIFQSKANGLWQRRSAYFLSKTQCLERRRFEVFLLSSSSFSSLLLFLLGAATRWTSVCVRHHHVDHFCHDLQWPECNFGRTYSTCGGTTVAPP